MEYIENINDLAQLVSLIDTYEILIKLILIHTY